MIRKLIWLFIIYIVLRTVAPDIATVVVGIGIASIITAINMAGEVVAVAVAQVSGQDITNATAAILLTLGILLALCARRPVSKRVKKLAD